MSVKRGGAVLRSPYREEITRALVSGVSKSELIRRYGVTRADLDKFERDVLGRILYEKGLKEERGVENALIDSVSTLKGMLDSMREWLCDPESPERFDLSPRAEEVEIVYEETDAKGNLVRKKGNLQELLDRTVGKASVLRVDYKGMDTRVVFIRAAESLGRLLSLVLKSKEGVRQEAGNITINFNSVQNAALQVAAIRQQMLDSAPSAGREC